MSDSTADAQETAPTGERFDPTRMGGHLIEAEHFVRYAWAAQFAQGKRVLDAACGMAYGTAMLAAAGATATVGVDLDSQVIDKVSAAAPSGTSFRVGDLRDLPFDDDEFDLVVCFEAIEHVPDPEVVLDELARVLVDDGVLLVSTPNRNVYLPGNPFHLRELTPNELESELDSRFKNVSLRRQHTWVASAVLDDEAFNAGANALVDGVEVRKAQGDDSGTETYTLGIASDGALPEGKSLVDLTLDVDLRDWSFRLDAADLAISTARPPGERAPEAELDSLRKELTELRRQLVKGESESAHFADLEARVAAAQGAVEEYDALKRQIERMEEEYEQLQESHRQVLTSSSWRVTAPLRRFSRFLSSPS